MTATRNDALGGIVALTGLVLALCAGYFLVGLAAAAGIGPVDPEMTLIPAGIAIAAALVVYWGHSFPKKASNIRLAIAYIAGLPTSVILALSCAQAALVVGEPLYRENRAEALNVLWREHLQQPGRVTFQIPGGEPYWLTLREQDGLLEHLKQGGRDRVKLNVVELIDRKKRVTRFFAKDLDGFKLKRQYFGGQYFPGSDLIKYKNSGSSNHSLDRPAAR